jgi:hypothetical protein
VLYSYSFFIRWFSASNAAKSIIGVGLNWDNKEDEVEFLAETELLAEGWFKDFCLFAD